MRQLLLVRHGESRWNAEGRIQGQSCAGLGERGQEQARALAAAYGQPLRARAAEVPGSVRLYTSDLQRAVETAAPLADAAGVAAVPDPRLRERAFGAWEGRSHTELAVEDPDRWVRWTRGEDLMHEIGAETARELAVRVAPALWELLDTTPQGGVTIAVSHGGSIWHGLHDLLSLPPRSLGPVGNASVAELLLLAAPDDGAAHCALASFNDQSHLPGELRTGGFTAGRTTDAVPQMR